MTGAQASYLTTLAEQAGEPPPDAGLSKAEASQAIDRLRTSLRYRGSPPPTRPIGRWGSWNGLTTAQSFIQRISAPRVASGVVTRASGAMGSTTKKLRMGYEYVSTYVSTPAATVAACGVYTKLLSSDEKDDLFAYWHEVFKDAGVVLWALPRSYAGAIR